MLNLTLCCAPLISSQGHAAGGCASLLSQRQKTHSILPKTQHKSEESKNLPEMQSSILKAAHRLPSIHIQPKIKRKKKQESTLLIALPWSCSPFMWFQCLSRSSLHFQRTACRHTHTTQLLNGLHPTVCVLTLLLLPRRKTAHACICRHTQRLSKRHCLHLYSSVESLYTDR